MISKLIGSILVSYLLAAQVCSGVLMTYVKPYERAPGPVIIHEAFTDSSINANWLNLGNASATIYNSNVLLVSGTTITNWFLYTNWYTCDENLRIEYDQFQIVTNASSIGPMFGWKSASATGTRNLWMGLYCAYDGDQGKIKIGRHDNTTLTEIREAPAGLIVTNFGNAWINVTIIRNQNIWNVWATNTNNGSYSHTNFTFLLQESGNITPTASYFGFNNFGISNLIDNVKITIDRRIPIELGVMGKSIDDGSSVTNIQDRWFNKFTNDLPTGRPQGMVAGGFNYTSNYIRLFPSMLALRPQHQWVMFPTDPIAGVSSNIWSSNANYYVTNARAYGMNVNLAAATPNEAADYRPWNIWVSNNVPAGNNVVYAGWDEMLTNNPAAYSIKDELTVADGVHLNHWGAATQYNAMLPRRKRL